MFLSGWELLERTKLAEQGHQGLMRLAGRELLERMNLAAQGHRERMNLAGRVQLESYLVVSRELKRGWERG